MGSDPKDQTWKGAEHPQPASTEPEPLSGHGDSTAPAAGNTQRQLGKDPGKTNVHSEDSSRSGTSQCKNMPGKRRFQVLPEVPWAGNAGSASRNKEQLRTAVQPLVSEVKAGQSCSVPAPAPSRTPALPAPHSHVCQSFCRKGSGGEEKHNYHLTHSQSADRELQKGDHNTERPKGILLVQEECSG